MRRERGPRAGGREAVRRLAPSTRTRRQLLAQPDLDLVTIGLPNVFHAPVAIAALEAGKHVLCEKPMSVTAAGAEAMLAAATASGKLLSVNQHMRFDRSSLRCATRLPAARLGDVYLADVRMVRQNGIPGTAAGSRTAISPATARCSTSACTCSTSAVRARLPRGGCGEGVPQRRGSAQRVGLGSWGDRPWSLRRYDVDDTAAATLTLARGGQIRLHVAWAAFAPAEERLTVYGSLGGPDRDRGGQRRHRCRFFGADGDGVIAVLPVDESVQTGGRGWSGAIDSFVRSVRDGEPLVVRPEETRATTRILERIVESAAEGSSWRCRRRRDACASPRR